MKNLTFILVVFTLVSCGNKKAEIVEQIKSYKDSSMVASRSILQLTIDDGKKYEELYYTNGEADYKKLSDNKLRKEYIDYQAKIGLQKFQIEIKQAGFKSKIDSLELELKKY